MSDRERRIERIHTIRRRLDLGTSLLIMLPIGFALKAFGHGLWITLGIPLGVIALLWIVYALLGLLLPKGQRYTPASDWDPM
ncbi:hypothetical protein HPO96_26480 [Kribbella sandramycini]|uniref:Uncharacterized protein n=1 Tax=Kribbella sandramycini TaxID=60450 RepID=A0A7Y4L5Y8_9ACTN|nr:hypothetical protein [Kribbella sandramycini]MBB6570657.1 hypothetical protein [Kribbella sandramycini]NOL43801.1 hypothetical protein [Kribbella sandramycini]